MSAKFERDHRVVGFFVEQKELSSRISAATSASNPGRNLFPIRHFYQRIVSATGLARPVMEIRR
jgi:hypothetical protein